MTIESNRINQNMLNTPNFNQVMIKNVKLDVDYVII